LGLHVLVEKMAHPKRFELLTPRFVVWCSIQLSYGCVAETEGTVGVGGSLKRPSGECKWICEKDGDFRKRHCEGAENSQFSCKLRLR
jgi:hypothetical protein